MEPFNGIFHSRKDIHWRLSTILKASKKVYEVMFLICKVCISWKYIQYTINWNKTNVKEIRSDKINSRKNALLFLSQAPTHHSFIFNLRFLYELKHKVRLSKTMCGIFLFRFRSVFIKVYIFVQKKCMDSLTIKRHNSFQSENNR